MNRIVFRNLAVHGAAALLVLSASCVPLAAPSDNEVVMRNIAFVPDEITVNVGETVTWTNQDLVVHTVTSGNPGDELAGEVWDSGNLGNGGTFSFTFNESGEFVYFCRPHSGTMRDARVIVVEAP